MNEIHNAVRISDLDAIAHSLKAGRDVNARNEMGFTPLHELCMCSGDVAMAEFLLHHGARAEARDGRGRTPLHYAAGAGYVELLQLFLSRGVDVNARDNWGETPLHWAALGGRPDVVTLLLTSNAAADGKDRHGETPLAWATYKGNREVMVILMKALTRRWRFRSATDHGRFRGRVASVTSPRTELPGIMDRSRSGVERYRLNADTAFK